MRCLERHQLADFLAVVNPTHRTLFKLLAAAGLRISEALASQWRHVQLDGERPHIKVRRGFVKGRIQPPKSKYGRRDVPLSAGLVNELRARRADGERGGEDDLVFPSEDGHDHERGQPAHGRPTSWATQPGARREPKQVTACVPAGRARGVANAGERTASIGPDDGQPAQDAAGAGSAR